MMSSPNIASTVLVVEDTPEQMEIISVYLQQGGYTVIPSQTAQEAIDLAMRHQPQVIISDVVMPDMSGFELCRSLRKNPATAQIPFVFCSAKDEHVDRLWGMKQGASAYITKPYHAEELLQTIEAVQR